MDEVYMDIPAVRSFSKTFNTISETLETVSKALEALANILKATAFIGLVGGMAVVHFIEMVQPPIEEMAEKCAEISQDLSAAVDAFERGDAIGATRFY